MNEDDEYGMNGMMARPYWNQNQPLLDKHLDATQIIDNLKNLLLGKEYDASKGSWVDTVILIQDNYGTIKRVSQGPLIDPKKIQSLVNYLQMLLNSNTYLSRLDKEEVNNLMWDIEKELVPVFFRLLRRKKIDSDIMRLLWGMTDKPIFLGLKRASETSGGGMTINAATKMQHSIERIDTKGPSQQDDKQFKIFGM